MSRVLTIVPERNPDIDQAAAIAKNQITQGRARELRPATVLGDAIEVIIDDGADRDAIAAEYLAAGFTLVEEHRD
jgi:hypothetical protein